MTHFTIGFICGILTAVMARWLDRRLTETVETLLSVEDTYGTE